jgi:hypothetical protein
MQNINKNKAAFGPLFLFTMLLNINLIMMKSYANQGLQTSVANVAWGGGLRIIEPLNPGVILLNEPWIAFFNTEILGLGFRLRNRFRFNV